MKTLFALPILALLLLASQADAQLFRRFAPAQSGCANGQCAVPSAMPATQAVAANAKPETAHYVPREELDAILGMLDAKPEWRKSVKLIRGQLAEWRGEKTVLVDAEAFAAWQDAAGVREPAMRSLDTKSFAGGLQSHLKGKQSLSFSERRLLRILNEPDSPRRDRQVARMERFARAELNQPTGAIDWNAIDWAAILRLLLTLLPLFL